MLASHTLFSCVCESASGERRGDIDTLNLSLSLPPVPPPPAPTTSPTEYRVGEDIHRLMCTQSLQVVLRMIDACVCVWECAFIIYTLSL